MGGRDIQGDGDRKREGGGGEKRKERGRDAERTNAQKNASKMFKSAN